METAIIPTPDSVAGMSKEELSTLRPTQVHFTNNNVVARFGMTLNNGQQVFGCTGKTNQDAELPDHITQIDVEFEPDEGWIYALVFHGSTTLDIRGTDNENEGGRKETVVLEPGEHLHGCEMHFFERQIRGITFLICSPPED